LKVDISNDGQTYPIYHPSLDPGKPGKKGKQRISQIKNWGAAVTCLAATHAYIEMRLI